MVYYVGLRFFSRRLLRHIREKNIWWLMVTYTIFKADENDYKKCLIRYADSMNGRDMSKWEKYIVWKNKNKWAIEKGNMWCMYGYGKNASKFYRKTAEAIWKGFLYCCRQIHIRGKKERGIKFKRPLALSNKIVQRDSICFRG